jgi:cytochrome c biogenesis protein CcmG, thiol:disulfide interchange protein DsbE
METLPSDDRAPAPPRRGMPRGAWWAVALAIVVLAVAGLKATSSTTSTTDGADVLDPSATQPVDCNPLLPCTDPVGKPVPTTGITRFDGTATSLADHAGTPMVVNFWASDCTPCLSEMPDLEAVHQQYGDRVAFVGVDVQDSRDAARTMAARTGVTYELVSDPEGTLATSVGAIGLPTTLLVGADGTVVRIAGPGAVKADDLRRWIDQDLLA